MGSEWEIVPLARLVEAGRGISYGIVQPGSHVPHGVPIVRVADVKSGRISTAEPLRVSPDVERAYARTRLRGGELLLTLVGTVGESAVVPDTLAGWNTARAVAVVPVRKDPGAYWVKLALTSESARAIISSRLNTTVQATLNLGDVAQLPIVMPPQQDREAIAGLTGALDDKIELNRRTNETLEAMARALFKSWFVDFDPVRAKAEGRDPGLPQEIASLFPAAFEESKLGPTPTGWPVRTLSDVCAAIFSGGTPSTDNPAFWGGGLPWLSSGETRERFIVETEKTITQAGVDGSSTRFARAGATVVAGAGQGKTRGQSSMLLLDTFINQSVVALRADTEVISSCYLFFDLERRYDEFRQLSDSHSSRGSLTTKLLASVQTLAPPMRVVELFDDFAAPLVNRIKVGLIESRNLSRLRDALLPKLISGELRVPDAEHLVSEVV